MQTQPPAPHEPEPVPTEPSKPTEPAPQEPEPISTEPEPTQPSQPSQPEFDVNYWVSYAQSYAQSVGLRLESSAVDCWDNPIGAGAHCIYLERDIQSCLNRYARDEDITDVWIWAEPTGNGCYDLYIGYA